jgi:hypothetical protein
MARTSVEVAMPDWVLAALSGATSVASISRAIYDVSKKDERGSAALYSVVAFISFLVFAIFLTKSIRTKPAAPPQTVQQPVKHDEAREPEHKTTMANAVSGGAEIARIGPISPKAWQKVVITGAHFAMGKPYNGCSDFLRVTDLTDNRVFGAFAPGEFCYSPVYVSSWRDTEIVIEGFPSFKQGQDVFKVDDVIKIEVANFTQEGWVTSGDNFRGMG